jgi:hypothetical protein
LGVRWSGWAVIALAAPHPVLLYLMVFLFELDAG